MIRSVIINIKTINPREYVDELRDERMDMDMDSGKNVIGPIMARTLRVVGG